MARLSDNMARLSDPWEKWKGIDIDVTIMTKKTFRPPKKASYSRKTHKDPWDWYTY